MRPLPPQVYWAISLMLILIVFVLWMPSIPGLLLSLILVFAVADFCSRRRRLAAFTFNSAVRAVCHQDGAVGKVAVAFSRTGPLSGPCYDYARRLMMGEHPIDAANSSGIPLQLSTAIALEVPTGPTGAPPPSLDHDHLALSRDRGAMPVYGQVFYLLATACLCFGVLTWMSVKVVPDVKGMLEDYGSGKAYVAQLRTTPLFAILAVLAFVVFVVMPILNRGHWLGIRFDRWISISPTVARRKGETLCGLADAIDAGIPLGRALTIGHTVAVRTERRRLENAMQAIAQGTTPPQALRHARLIGMRDEPWLEDQPPERLAGVLRGIAEQNIRDAEANLRAVMAVFFPVIILMLGAAVMAYAYGFVGALMELIHESP